MMSSHTSSQSYTSASTPVTTIFLVSLLLLCFSCAVDAEGDTRILDRSVHMRPGPPVTNETSYGVKFSGKWIEANTTTNSSSATLAAFEGIRYGVQPVRFQDPFSAYPPNQATEPTVINATTHSAWCPQVGCDQMSGCVMSEDCLFLNVYAPASVFEGDGGLANSSLPVLFWIHGGGLMVGSAYMYPNVHNLAALGDVIVVTINYRLDVFGFLSLDELTEVDSRNTSGNYGFLDQQLALMWVQDSIASFGGDPSRVTLIGQSSGGTSIFALMASPLSNGLFHAAISLSGSPNITMDPPSANAYNQRFVGAAECDGLVNASATVRCLRELSVNDTLQASSSSLGWDFNPVGYPFPNTTAGQMYPGMPVVDGVVITLPFSIALDQPIIDVPLILQSTLGEMAIMIDPASLPFDHGSNRTHLIDALTTGLDPVFGGSAGRTVAAAYGLDSVAGKEEEREGRMSMGSSDNNYIYNSNSSNVSNTDVFYKMTADFGITCPNIQLSQPSANTTRTTPVYLSLVAQGPSHPFDSMAGPGVTVDVAFHMWDYFCGAEDWAMFCELGMTWMCGWEPAAADVSLGATLRGMWFALATNLTLASSEYACPSSFVSDLPSDTQASVPLSTASASANWNTCLPLSNGTAAAMNDRSEQCDAWLKIGFGMGEWWCN